MFILGNYLFLHPFTRRNGKERQVTRTSNRPVVVNKILVLLDQKKIARVNRTSYKAVRKETKYPNLKWTLPLVHKFNDKPKEIESNKIKVDNDNSKEMKNNIIDRKTIEPILTHMPTMAVLVISCNRPTVKRCLDGIFKYKPGNVQIPVIVSQDCGHESTAEAIRSYGDKVIHIKQPDLEDVRNVPQYMMRYMGYYKISRHYKWALNQTFSRPGIDSVIIVEDDLDIGKVSFVLLLLHYVSILK